MEIRWLGRSTFEIKSALSTVIFDPFPGLPQPVLLEEGRLVATASGAPRGAVDLAPWPDVAKLVQGPGEYEIAGLAFRGVPVPVADKAARAYTTAFSLEAERLVVQRVGQDIFRDGLLDYWEGRCAMTGLGVPALLRASHIKPWADCENDAERLDVFNGFLLAPHLDAAFDQGFITVQNDGQVMVATALDEEARALLGLDVPLSVAETTDGHRIYLPWHPEHIFHGCPSV